MTQPDILAALATPQQPIACLGETMVSMAPTPGEPLSRAASLTIGIAGAESNVAMYLSDYGIPARWISRVGDDPFGRRVVEAISATGVDVGCVEVDPHRPTGLLVKDPGPQGTLVHYYRQNSAAAAMTSLILDQPAVRCATLLHLSGVTPALSPSCAELMQTALQPGPNRNPIVSFDVNFRPRLWPEHPRQVLLNLSNQADIVFVGLDEADRLWGRCPNPDSVRAMLPTTPVLVVKDGPRGATAYAGQQSLFVPAPALAVVEVVGSGDAFAAGFLTGLIRGATLETALRLGHLTAASALLVTDDHGPLLGPEVIEPLLAATTDEWAAVRLSDGSDA